MNKKTLTLRTIITSIVIFAAAALMMGILATTVTQVALAQGNSRGPAVPSDSQKAPGSKTATTTTTNPTTATTITTTGTNFVTYENSTLGIKIQYPSNWTKQSTGKGVAFVVLLPNSKNIKNNNNNNTMQQFLAKLNVTSVGGIPPSVPLKALADRVIDGYRHFLHNFKIESYTNATYGASNKNNNAIKIVYSYTDPKSTNLKATDLATIKNNRLYVVQYYYVQLPKYQNYSQILKKMADSFQISS